MAITTTWSVLNMERKQADGSVFEVRWQCVAKNDAGPESAMYGGESKFEPDSSAPGYTPYDQLTEAQVLDWIWATDDCDKNEIEADRTAKVEAQIARKTAEATGMPWVTEKVAA